jgi:hypothetical protein
MSTHHTRKYLRLQGYAFDDASFAEIGPWMRWPYIFCASILVSGVALASPTILWTLAAVAAASVFLPAHPFSYVYNHGVRHLTGTRPLPRSSAQARFAGGGGALFLIGIGYAFHAGAPAIGYVAGSVMASMCVLVASTQLCVPSLLYKAAFGEKTISVTQLA